MSRLIRVVVALALAILAVPLRAQEHCTALFDQLDAIESQGGDAEQDLAQARSTYEQLNCPSFPTDPGCSEIAGHINSLQNSGVGNNNLGRERQRVLAALKRAGCMRGEGARRAWEDAIEGAQNPDVFRDLQREGGGEDVWQSSPRGGDNTIRFGNDGSGRYRTLCVRKCDGYFWPISYSARAGSLAGDAAACQASCPNQEVELFHLVQGQENAEAVSGGGEPYASLANAFVYQKRYVPACACKSEALADADKVRQVQEQEQQKAIDAAAARAKEQTLPQPEPQADVYRSTPRPIVIDPNVPDSQESEKATGPNGLRGVSPEQLQEE